MAKGLLQNAYELIQPRPSAPPLYRPRASTLELEQWVLKPEWVLDGQPRVRGKILTSSSDGRTQSGVWECVGPTRFRFIFDVDESIFVTEGRAVVETDTTRLELGPGDAAYFPAGLTSVWTVAERVRKNFTLSAVSPARQILRRIRLALTMVALAFAAPLGLDDVDAAELDDAQADLLPA